MSKPDTPYRKRALGDRALSPETLMMSYGFDAKMSEGSIKPPVFLTSTFAFATAEEGAAYFRIMGGNYFGKHFLYPKKCENKAK